MNKCDLIYRSNQAKIRNHYKGKAKDKEMQIHYTNSGLFLAHLIQKHSYLFPLTPGQGYSVLLSPEEPGGTSHKPGRPARHAATLQRIGMHTVPQEP